MNTRAGWQPSVVTGLIELASEHHWWALVEYVSPAYLVRFTQYRSDAKPALHSYLAEFRNRGGWVCVGVREEIRWNPAFVTVRHIDLHELKLTIKGF